MDSAISDCGTMAAVLIDEWRESTVHWYKRLGACHGILLGVYPTGYLHRCAQPVDALLAPVGNVAPLFGMEHLAQQGSRGDVGLTLFAQV